MADASQISTAFGVIGNATSLCLFLSPVSTFYRIFKKKSVEEFSEIPYAATFLNCLLWVLYGLPIVKVDGTLVLVVNAAGAVIELSYLFVFLLYSNKRKRARALLLLLLELTFFAAAATAVLLVCHTHASRTFVVGILCIIFCMSMYIAPLFVLRMVIKTKSVEFLPLYLSIVSFFNCLFWSIYAIISFDSNILIPNCVGLVFSTAQLVLHAMYYKSTKKQLEERKFKGDAAPTDVSVNIKVVAADDEFGSSGIL